MSEPRLTASRIARKLPSASPATAGPVASTRRGSRARPSPCGDLPAPVPGPSDLDVPPLDLEAPEAVPALSRLSWQPQDAAARPTG